MSNYMPFTLREVLTSRYFAKLWFWFLLDKYSYREVERKEHSYPLKTCRQYGLFSCVECKKTYCKSCTKYCKFLDSDGSIILGSEHCFNCDKYE